MAEKGIVRSPPNAKDGADAYNQLHECKAG